MITINQIWLSTTAMDMRCGSGRLLAHIIKAHQGIKPNCAYLFYNKTGSRVKVLVHDGIGVWLCTRQLDDGRFLGLTNQIAYASTHTGITLNREQFDALINGLPWRNMGKDLLIPTL